MDKWETTLRTLSEQIPPYMIWVVMSVAIVICIGATVSSKKRKVVHDSSVLLKKLLDLNSKYNFNQNLQKKYTFMISLQTKQKFDRYKLIDLLDDKILHNGEFNQAIKEFRKNWHLYPKYCDEVSHLRTEITEEQTKELHISYKEYLRIEEKLFLKQQVKPLLQSEVLCIASYSSPKGRNHYSKKAEYTISAVINRYGELMKQVAYSKSEEARKKRARSQMTEKLRYSILKRDGFRCKICGRTVEDGVKLHVDHIVPVAKGGETVPSNLRTLCEDCNWGKSDEIE